MSRSIHRSISTKVIASFIAVVLFQGIISIVAVTWILSRTASATLDNQIIRSGYLVEKYFNEEARYLRVKANLLAGRETIIDMTWRSDSLEMHAELNSMLDSLRLDGAFIVDDSLNFLASAGNQEIVDIAQRNGIVFNFNTGSTVLLTGEGSKMQMWGVYPIVRNKHRVGVLFAGMSLNRNFLSRIEEACNVNLIFSLRRNIMLNGHLSDPMFLEYMRRSFSNPGEAESGTIDSFVYRLVHFSVNRDLTAIYFIDTSPAQSVLIQYTLFSILFLIVVLIIGTSMAIVLYRVSFQKPFWSFQQAIRAISRGDLQFHARTEARDEFGDLEKEFEVMTVNLRKLEDKLQMSSRMAAVGEMVAGVAHQIRNPLGIMKVSAGMLGEAFADTNDPDGHYRKLVEMISGEVDTLSEIITNFLDFTRPLIVRKEDINVYPLLQHAIDMIDKERFPGVSIQLECSPEIGLHRLDRTLIGQVLSNLLVNALEASGPGQTVTLSATRETQKQNLHVRIQDQGSGMPIEIRNQIFHPFFTTKNTGTGLGLSIVHRIMESHASQIEFDSELGVGTCFHLIL